MSVAWLAALNEVKDGCKTEDTTVKAVGLGGGGERGGVVCPGVRVSQEGNAAGGEKAKGGLLEYFRRQPLPEVEKSTCTMGVVVIQGIIVGDVSEVNIHDYGSPVNPTHIDWHVYSIAVEGLSVWMRKVMLNIPIVEVMVGVAKARMERAAEADERRG